jgi:hypothetical protein
MEDAELKIVFQQAIDKLGEKEDLMESQIEKLQKELIKIKREIRRKEKVSKEWFGEVLKKKKKEKEVENVRE